MRVTLEEEEEEGEEEEEEEESRLLKGASSLNQQQAQSQGSRCPVSCRGNVQSSRSHRNQVQKLTMSRHNVTCLCSKLLES